MNLYFDTQIVWLFAGVVALLGLAAVVSTILARRPGGPEHAALVENLRARLRSWWIMVAIIFLTIVAGEIFTVILFAIVSFLALREFITMTPTHRGDHRALFWTFFIITPLHYWYVGTHWFGMFAIFIPVYAFLFIPLRSALAGESERYLERTAKIQWGLMVCVYCLSHVPALLMLPIEGYEGENAKLLLFLVLVVQLSDVLQYVFGKTLGRRPIAPRISPNKTWEGFIGGVLTASLLGACLWKITPYTPWQTFGLALLIALMGFAGGLVMSAIKRDRGIKDYGVLLPGHGGMMDRIDSLCFAAPIFFHITRYYFT